MDTIKLLEACGVMRWHSAPRFKTKQTTGEHSQRMSVLLYCLFEGKEEPTTIANVARAITFHDSAELLTGDAPYLVKKNSTVLKEELDRLEVEALNTLGLSLDLTDREQKILKFVDSLEANLWMVEQRPQELSRSDVQQHVQEICQQGDYLQPGLSETVVTLIEGYRDDQ